MSSRQKQAIVVWDFDWCLVNQNTDVFPFSYHNSSFEYAKKRKLALANGYTVPGFMNDVAWPALFKKIKTNEKLKEALRALPIEKENLTVLRSIAAYGKTHDAPGDNEKARGAHQYIISNSNTMLIDTILKHHRLLPSVFWYSEIYTNPGWFDEKTGQMRCKPYHNQEKTHSWIRSTVERPPNGLNHDCDIGCPVNMCKGKIMTEQIFPREEILPAEDRIVVYIGDGGTDYCAVARLGENDFAFVRQFKEVSGLQKRVQDDDGVNLKCTVLLWENGPQLLRCFQTAFPFIEFNDQITSSL